MVRRGERGSSWTLDFAYVASTICPRWGQPCGARSRQTGYRCQGILVMDRWTGKPRNGRCRMHGDQSTGPRTSVSRAAVAASNRRRAQARSNSTEQPQFGRSPALCLGSGSCYITRVSRIAPRTEAVIRPADWSPDEADVAAMALIGMSVVGGASLLMVNPDGRCAGARAAKTPKSITPSAGRPPARRLGHESSDIQP